MQLGSLTAIDWMVLLAAAAAITGVNWYFFVAGRAPVSAPAGGAVQQLTITVDGGYSPKLIRVRAGQPVRLLFDRKDRSGCSEEVVFPDFGLRRYLPTGQPTAIEVTPPAPGRYEFTCGMSMLRGVLVAE